MSVHLFPDIPRTVVGKTATLYRRGLPAASGRITALRINIQEDFADGIIVFDGLTSTVLCAPDGTTDDDCKLEVKDK